MSTKSTWMRTQSGRVLQLTEPNEDAINLEDIAYSLARLHRFTGHIDTTVAQHSVSVMMGLYNNPAFMNIAECICMEPRAMLLTALLHDAHEAYTGDISLPMKQAIGEVADKGMYQLATDPVTLIKRDIQREIHLAFGLTTVQPDALSDAIEVADRKALDIEVWLEAQGLTAWTAAEAEDRFYTLAWKMWMDDHAANFIGQYAWNEDDGYGAEVS